MSLHLALMLGAERAHMVWSLTTSVLLFYNAMQSLVELDDEDAMQEFEGQEAPREMLSSTDEEAWTLRSFAAGSVTVARSLLWPGASSALSTTKQSINIYVGYGVPFSADTYSPAPPPAIQGQYESEEKEFKISDDVLDAPVVEQEEGEGDE